MLHLVLKISRTEVSNLEAVQGVPLIVLKWSYNLTKKFQFLYRVYIYIENDMNPNCLDICINTKNKRKDDIGNRELFTGQIHSRRQQ